MSAKRARTRGSSRSPEKKKSTDEHPTVSVTEFYEQEDREAMSMNMSAIEELFLEHSRMLRQKITDLCSAPMKSQEASSLAESLLSRFISLRRLNRLAQFRNRKIRDRVSRERAIVEERSLQLQNVKSEIEHLQKEIERCYDFRSADEQIELLPLEEFYASAPPNISQEEVTRKDPHRLHLARLNWEMEERKNLVGTLLEREGRKSVLISDITTKEHRLKSLKPKIEAIIEAARPVQELMGLASSAPIDVEKERVLSLLPQELSVIVVQVEAYCDIVGEAGIVMKCKGDYESAMKFLENQQHVFEVIEDEDEESREDYTGKQSPAVSLPDKRRISMKELIVERKDAIVAPHPIHIEMEITCQDNVCVTLVLQFVPGLRSVGVMVRVSRVPSSFYGNVLFDECLIDEIFDDDDGSKCLNTTGQAKLDQLRISAADLESKVGRFYVFAQKMAGLDDDGDGSKNSQLCDLIHFVVGRIRSRVRSRCTLARITHSLQLVNRILQTLKTNETPDELKLFEELKNRNDYPAIICAKLTDFRMITAEQFFENPSLTDDYRKLIKYERKAYVDKQLYFSAAIERSPGAKLCALIYVDIKYPKVTPIFMLSFVLNDTEFTAATCSMVNQMERALNLEFLTYTKCEDLNDLMEAQMAFLVSRFDILLEAICAVSGSEQFSRSHLFVRSHRGRDHQLPLYYQKNINAFSFLP